MIPFRWLEQADERIKPFIVPTPFTYDEQNNLYLKWESHQVTGSFKARGALNKVLSLQPWELARGLVTASAGNHGQGVALAAKIAGAAVTVFTSEHASENKVLAMENLGARVRLIQGGYSEAEQAGIEYAQEFGSTWISPYNDGLVIAGQGTIALEVLKELPASSPITWVVPAGGGGVVSGIGCALHELSPGSKLVAVQSDASSFLFEIYHHGTQDNVVELPSLADGLSGPVEHGSVTVPMVKNLVDEFVLVTEGEIRKAIKYTWDHYHERIEGSAAVTLAAILSGKISDRPAVLIMTGGNINPIEFEKILKDPDTGSFR